MASAAQLFARSDVRTFHDFLTSVQRQSCLKRRARVDFFLVPDLSEPLFTFEGCGWLFLEEGIAIKSSSSLSTRSSSKYTIVLAPVGGSFRRCFVRSDVKYVVGVFFSLPVITSRSTQTSSSFDASNFFLKQAWILFERRGTYWSTAQT